MICFPNAREADHPFVFNNARVIYSFSNTLTSCETHLKVCIYGKRLVLLWPEILNTKHIHYQLRCKSHTCERLDVNVLHALANMEYKLKLTAKREPALTSILRQKKSIVDTALIAFLKLVNVEGGSKTVSLVDQFHQI